MVSDLDRPLDGLVALVTGGAGHLGSAMTAKLAERDARVGVADVDAQRAADHAASIVTAGFEEVPVEMDVSSEESVDSALGAPADHFGGVDILVNNAAPSRLIAQDSTVRDIDLGIWDRTGSLAVLRRRRDVPPHEGKGVGEC